MIFEYFSLMLTCHNARVNPQSYVASSSCRHALIVNYFSPGAMNPAGPCQVIGMRDTRKVVMLHIAITCMRAM